MNGSDLKSDRGLNSILIGSDSVMSIAKRRVTLD